MSREPTRYQISSKLAYNAQTPSFLQKMQRRVEGKADEDEDDEYEWDGSGRPPIPRRPSIPERPEGDHGSADEDDGDEAPQVVVLKEGKHLTAHEAENERRKAKGLSPLPDPEEHPSDSKSGTSATAASEFQVSAKSRSEGLSFSSGSTSRATKKRKHGIIEDTHDDRLETKKPAKTRKAKKLEKKLLSFGDGDA